MPQTQLKRAETFEEIDNAVQFADPVMPDDDFFTEFNQARGEFQERRLFRMLNARKKRDEYHFDAKVNSFNKTLLFLGGMRGSGKTTELNKYAKLLENPNAFFVVTCNIDNELDMNDIEYMDILILQVEKLLDKANNSKGCELDDRIVKHLSTWSEARVEEIKTALKGEVGFEIGVEAKTPSLLAKLYAKLRSSMSGSKEVNNTIRRTLKNHFNDFALYFNLFLEEVNQELRRRNKAQEVLFIIDGLEKTLTADTRRKIIMEESNRIRQIKANTIFTLPIELLKERELLEQFSSVMSFPYVKVCDRQGNPQSIAFDAFRTFVNKRIAPHLIDSQATIDIAIQYSGGSPRELLRILEYATFMEESDESGQIQLSSVKKAIEQLGNQKARYLTKEQLDKLKEIQENNQQHQANPYDQVTDELLEKLILMEYNDGSLMMPNPLVTVSEMYRQYVDETAYKKFQEETAA